jgi:hypothetical protein
MRLRLVVSSLLALAVARSTTTVEKLHAVPDGWTEVGVPAADQKLHFRIAVRSVSTGFSGAWRDSRVSTSQLLTKVGRSCTLRKDADGGFDSQSRAVWPALEAKRAQGPDQAAG